MLNVKGTDSFKSEKILSFEKAKKLIVDLKTKNKKVGLCHGGFDLLHPGHVKHFESAKNLCDVLIVSLTSDEFVSTRKGSGRPIFNDELRSYMVSSIQFVDYVVISHFKTGIEVIKTLKPDYYIKGPDYVKRDTTGINAEKEAAVSIGGKIKYTEDPKISTTQIIEYVKDKIDDKVILLILDRDGTLIEDKNFLGKNKTWRDEIKLNEDVIDLILQIQKKYFTVKIVVTNQAGVARGYFTNKTVQDINHYIGKLLFEKNIKIDNWQYCPDVDSKYKERNKDEFKLNPEYVKNKTKRKPNTDMVFDGLKEFKKKIDYFDKIFVIGDKKDDEELAKNLKVKYISVKHKSSEEMIKDFENG